MQYLLFDECPFCGHLGIEYGPVRRPDSWAIHAPTVVTQINFDAVDVAQQCRPTGLELTPKVIHVGSGTVRRKKLKKKKVQKKYPAKGRYAKKRAPKKKASKKKKSSKKK